MTNEAEMDLYDDLDYALIQPLKEDIEKINAEEGEKLNAWKELEEELKKSKQENARLLVTIEQLEKNMSLFLATAHNEINRKDNKIKDLNRERDNFLFRRKKVNQKPGKTCEKFTQTEPATQRSRDFKADDRTRREENKDRQWIHEDHHNKERNKTSSSTDKNRSLPSRLDEKKSSREKSEDNCTRSRSSSDRTKDSRNDYRSSRKRSRSRSRDNSHKSVEENKRRKHQDNNKSLDTKNRKKEPDLREIILKRNASRTSTESKEMTKKRESPRKIKPKVKESLEATQKAAKVKPSDSESHKRASPRKSKQNHSESSTKLKQKQPKSPSEVLLVKSSDSEVEIVKETVLGVQEKAQELKPEEILESENDVKILEPIVSSQTDSLVPEFVPIEASETEISVINEELIQNLDVNRSKDVSNEVSPQTLSLSTDQEAESCVNLQVNISTTGVTQNDISIEAEEKMSLEVPTVINDLLDPPGTLKENSLNQSQENGKAKTKRRSYQKDVCEDGTLMITISRTKTKKKKDKKQNS